MDAVPSSMTLPLALALSELGRILYGRGWLPATSGNLSARIDAQHVLITASGRHKGRLGPTDFLVLGLDGQIQEPAGRPSAETPLHLAIYAAQPAVGAVLHVHSAAAAALSRARPEGISLQGWEIQKAFAGVSSHEQALVVPVLSNDQDTARLASAAERACMGSAVPGYCIAGHGIYAWGATLDDALRHLEAFDALFQLEILTRSLA